MCSTQTTVLRYGDGSAPHTAPAKIARQYWSAPLPPRRKSDLNCSLETPSSRLSRAVRKQMRPGRQVLVRAPYYRAAQLNLLSGLTLLSLSQATADGLSISRRWKRAPETINGFKYLINNRRTRCPRRCKKMCLVCAACQIESCRDSSAFSTAPINLGRTSQVEYNREAGETRVRARGGCWPYGLFASSGHGSPQEA